MSKTKNQSVDLSIIFPVHNEGASIYYLLKDTVRILQNELFTWEILCVENGSTDNTLEELKKSKNTCDSIKILQSDKGWGNAVKEGIIHAKGKTTCFMVSDGQIEQKYIPYLYSRYLSYTDKKHSATALFKIVRINRENRTRLVNSRIYNIIARMMFGIESRDINATPKMIDTKLVQSLPLTAQNIGIDLEILLHLRKRGYLWYEFSVPSKKREQGSSTTKISAIFEMLREIVRFKASGL